MFFETWFLVLGFIASIPLSQALKPNLHTQDRRGATIAAYCNSRFVGDINEGTCVQGDLLYKCTDCPPKRQILQYCIPIKDSIPGGWRIPGPGSKGITFKELDCPNFTNLIRNGRPFGYGCIDPIHKGITHFCGGVAASAKPRSCKRCIQPAERFDGWSL
ncbi:secreted protein [Melampsora americana]|nr:secreted protein [Melampsora americana]